MTRFAGLGGILTPSQHTQHTQHTIKRLWSQAGVPKIAVATNEVSGRRNIKAGKESTVSAQVGGLTDGQNCLAPYLIPSLLQPSPYLFNPLPFLPYSTYPIILSFLI